MAVAGRVAIVPKGEYVAGSLYKRLDLVTYNNKVFVAKADNSTVPVNGADWMFIMEYDKQKLDTTADKLTEIINRVNGLTAQSVGALPSSTKYAASETVGGPAKALAYRHVVNSVISGSDYIVYYSDGTQASYPLPSDGSSNYASGRVTNLNSNNETYVYITLDDRLAVGQTYFIIVDDVENDNVLLRALACAPDYFIITDSEGTVKTIPALNEIKKSYYYLMTYNAIGITISKEG